MKLWKLGSVIIFPILFTFLIIDCDIRNQHDDNSVIGFDTTNVPTLRVPEDIISIDAAVKILGKKGRVIVKAGTYKENIKIQSGTQIIIQADSSEHPTLSAAKPELPVIYIAPEASLYLAGMSVYGTKSGLVFGSDSNGKAAHSVTIMRTLVAKAEYGIYGLAEKFYIESSIIENNIYGLIVAGSSSIINTIITSNAVNILLSGNIPFCTEATYSTSGKQVLVEHSTIMYGQQGGLSICNVESAKVKDCFIWKNYYIGVQIHNTTNFILNNIRVGETQYSNGDKWGDGLVVVRSNGDVMNSQFSANKRANIIYYGNSGGTIDNNLIIYAIFALDLEGRSSPIITNNFMYGNKENQVTYGNELPIPQLPPVPVL